MFNKLCKCWPVCGTIQPAIQHGLISMNTCKCGSQMDQVMFLVFSYTASWQLSAHISLVAYSGALILVPSFSLLQKDSSMQTPGYGEAPKGDRGNVLSYYSSDYVGWTSCCHSAYLGKRSPREGPQRTKHHSVWCTLCQK